jgi:hypothetical protein
MMTTDPRVPTASRRRQVKIHERRISMLIEVDGDFFQHDKVAIVSDYDIKESEVSVSGHAAFRMPTESPYIKKLVGKIREAERQVRQNQIHDLSRAFRGFES